MLHEYASFTFEDICLQYVQELQKANALPFRYSKIGRWFGRTTVSDPAQENGVRMAETEIDILAVSREMKKYFVGECKFKGRPFRYSEYLDVAAKLMPQKEKTEFYYGLFSESGFDEKVVEMANADERIWLYSLGEIVECKQENCSKQ